MMGGKCVDMLWIILLIINIHQTTQEESRQLVSGESSTIIDDTKGDINEIDLKCTNQTFTEENYIIWYRTSGDTQNKTEIYRNGILLTSNLGKEALAYSLYNSTEAEFTISIARALGQYFHLNRYRCEVIATNTGKELIDITGSVLLSIQYPPPAPYPLCTSTGYQSDLIGQNVILTCTTQLGNPIINIEWWRNEVRVRNEDVEYNKNKERFTEHSLDYTFNLRQEDLEATFQCRVKWKENFTTCTLDQTMVTEPETFTTLTSETSTIPTPETSTKPTPDTSTTPAPKTSTKPTSDTSIAPAPDTSTAPAPDTSTAPTQETSITQTLETSTKQKPETSTKPTPETSTKPTLETSTKPTLETSTTQTPETSTTLPPEAPTTPTPETLTKPTPETPTKLAPETSTTQTPERLITKALDTTVASLSQSVATDEKQENITSTDKLKYLLAIPAVICACILVLVICVLKKRAKKGKSKTDGDKVQMKYWIQRKDQDSNESQGLSTEDNPVCDGSHTELRKPSDRQNRNEIYTYAQIDPMGNQQDKEAECPSEDDPVMVDNNFYEGATDVAKSQSKLQQDKETECLTEDDL
ncbi:uncharacterized protein [Antedon mediterranea]|uniref:uncharacterized protein n=1 Tax=Antedon mediterranea TaxID=105859 RepID=UPI003AF4CB4C